MSGVHRVTTLHTSGAGEGQRHNVCFQFLQGLKGARPPEPILNSCINASKIQHKNTYKAWKQKLGTQLGIKVVLIKYTPLNVQTCFHLCAQRTGAPTGFPVKLLLPLVISDSLRFPLSVRNSCSTEATSDKTSK